ncbi:MAG: penicillin-binding transpeptidase domain-containing protein [Bacteriovoracaceae bacterium]|nr:penicillin-binding transpeptidase domain-containing protein [Bacteriovoracaceae bacterium]
MNNRIRTRAGFTFIILSLIAVGIVIRGIYIQTSIKEKLKNYAASQYFRTVTAYPNRGNIYDRNGLPLAINRRSYDIFVMPKELLNNREIRKLCQILEEQNCNEYIKKIKHRNKFTYLEREIRLNEKQVKRIKDLEGIYVDEKVSRFYPNGTLAASLIGFVSVDNHGIGGVEFAYDQKLKGQAKVIRYMRDAKGRAIKFETIEFHSRGEDVYLTIDKDMQTIAEKFLQEGIAKTNAKGGGIGIMDAKSGEILAMANYPTFDPNEYNLYPPENRSLGFISNPFEPGSVFKTFTIAAAMEEGIVNPNTKFFCENGKFQIGNRTIGEASGHKFGTLSVAEILQNSSNIGTTKIAFALGNDKFAKYLTKYRIGEKTDIGLPSESRGIYQPKQLESKIGFSNISFGQGVALTGIQVLSLYRAIADNGEWMAPKVILDPTQDLNVAENKDNKQTVATPPPMMFSAKTREKLESMLKGVIDEGTGWNAKIDHYEIAGKTSTAQKVDKTGKYSGYFAAFAGYPSNVQNRFIIFVYIDEPKGKIYGNDVAAPIFANVAQSILYKRGDLNAAPMEEKSKELDLMALEQTLSIKSAKTIGAKKTDKKNDKKNDKKFDPKVPTIPDFRGLDKIQSFELADREQIYLESNGHGIVVSQEPSAGTKKSVQAKVKLHFQEPVYE